MRAEATMILLQEVGGRADAALAQARAAAAQAEGAAAANAARSAADAAGRAAREAAGVAGAAGPGGSSLLRDGSGNWVFTGPDGKTITIDGGAPLSGEQINDIVTTSMAYARPPAAPPGSHDGPPPGVIELVAIVMGCITLMVLLTPLIRAFVRRGEHRTAVVAPAPASPEIAQRLERIEQAVEAVAIEVERITEAQRFQSRLLAERAAAEPLTLPTREVADAR
jgi:hypothetical protein